MPQYPSSPPPSPWFPRAAFSLYVLITTAATMLQVTLAIIFTLGRRHFSQHPFYVVARHLLIADLLSLVAQIGVACVIPLLPRESALSYTQSPHYKYAVTVDTVGQLATYHFVFLQSLTQFRSTSPDGKSRSACATWLIAWSSFLCTAMWVWAATFLMLYYWADCEKEFSLLRLNFHFICDTRHSVEPSVEKTVWIGINGWFGAMLSTAVGIYTIGLVKTAKKRRREGSTASHHQTQHSDNNHNANNTLSVDSGELEDAPARYSILLQGLLISLSVSIRLVAFFALQWLANSPSQWLKEIFSFSHIPIIYSPSGAGQEELRTTLSIAENCIALASVASHPLIYAHHDERIAKGYKRLWRFLCGRRGRRVTAVTDLNGGHQASGVCGTNSVGPVVAVRSGRSGNKAAASDVIATISTSY